MNYNTIRAFEWDSVKSQACLDERGFDFAYVVRAFFDPKRIVHPDLRWDYGEERYQLLGCVGHRLFFVAYTFRSRAIRIISARKANRRELDEYENTSR